MIITENAKPILEKYLADEQKNCLTFLVEGRGCHSQLIMDFINADYAEEINGLKVLMDNDTKMMLENTVLDARNGQLVIQNLGSCGGCGGGCNSCGSESNDGCCGCGE